MGLRSAVVAGRRPCPSVVWACGNEDSKGGSAAHSTHEVPEVRAYTRHKVRYRAYTCLPIPK